MRDPADRFLFKKLNAPRVKIDRAFELDETEQIAGQWIRVTRADDSVIWYKISEIISAEYPAE